MTLFKKWQSQDLIDALETSKLFHEPPERSRLVLCDWLPSDLANLVIEYTQYQVLRGKEKSRFLSKFQTVCSLFETPHGFSVWVYSIDTGERVRGRAARCFFPRIQDILLVYDHRMGYCYNHYIVIGRFKNGKFFSFVYGKGRANKLHGQILHATLTIGTSVLSILLNLRQSKYFFDVMVLFLRRNHAPQPPQTIPLTYEYALQIALHK